MANVPVINIGGIDYNFKDIEARNQITDLKNALNNSEKQSWILNQLLKYSEYVNSGTGVISNSNDTHRTDFMPVKAGDVVCYRSLGVPGFDLLAMFTDNLVSHATDSYIGGTGNTSEGKYTVPQDGYIIITCLDSYTDGYLYIEQQSDYIEKVINEKIEVLQESIGDGRNQADNITIPGYVTSDEDGNVAGKIFSDSSDTKRSGFIPVQSGQSFIFDLRGVYQFLVVAFYTSQNEDSYVSGIKGNGAGNHVSGTFVAPQNGFVILTNMNSYAGGYFTNDDSIGALKEKVDQIENKISNPDVNGKYLLNFGDSLANGDGNYSKSYADIIAGEYNATLADYSASGNPFANYGQTQEYVCVRNQVRQAIIDHASDDVAIIFVEGAINDLKNETLSIGQLTDDFDGTYTENTIIGSAEAIFYELKNAFPTAAIIFVMYHHMPIQTQSVTYEQMLERENQEYQAFKSVCEKWSIPMADIFGKGSLNANIEEMAVRYFGTNASEKFGRDIAHPNNEGYKKFYVPAIKEALKMILFDN